MRKITLILLAFSINLFVSCSNDDSDGPITIDESLISGDWVLSDIISEDGKFTTTISGFPASGDFTTTGSDYTLQISFVETAEEEPNTFTSAGGFTAIVAAQIPSQDPIEIEQNFPDFFGSGEWSVNGNTLTTTVQGESQTYEIRELSATTMKLAIPIDESVPYEPLDITVDLTGTIIATLTKT